MVAHRGFVLVSRDIFEDFHRRWRAIDRQWDPLSLAPEHWDAVRGLRESSRNVLRAEAKHDARYAPGNYLIPI